MSSTFFLSQLQLRGMFRQLGAGPVLAFGVGVGLFVVENVGVVGPVEGRSMQVRMDPFNPLYLRW
jgi:hypothetical protein